MESPVQIANYQDFHNYLRLLTLLNEHGGFAFRKIFKSRYEALTASEWKDGSRAAKVFHQTLAKQVFKTGLPIQRKMLQDADLTKWDLALLSLVLQKINFSKDSVQITAEQENENRIIADLVKVRNSMEHLPGKTIPLTNFNALWQKASANLIALGVSAEDIEHIRSCKDLHGIEFKNFDEGAVNTENTVKARKLKEDGNAALKSNLITKAIQLYSTALNLYGVSRVERGILYSNRSLSYLKWVENPNSISEDEVNLNCELAMQDAKWTMQLRPLWFKGYFRLGKVLQFMKEWGSAIAAFDQALGLNIGDREILNARDSCRAMVNTASCQEHLQPIRMLNQMETQDYNDKMLKERGWTMPNAQKVLEMNQKFLESNENPELKADAYVYFGHRHKQGTDGFPQNYEKAAEFFLKAAELGHPEGLQNIALLYHTGKGVPQDVYVAAEYFEKAATLSTKGMSPGWIGKGVVAAQYSLAVCYEKGIGKLQDYTEAVRWYTMAMESGNGQAANNLGHMYYKGLGVVKSQERAIELWKLATSNGFSPALDNLIGAQLCLGNLDKAEHYHSQLVQTGNQLPSLRKSRFHDLLLQRRLLKQKTESQAFEDEAFNDPSLDLAKELKAFSGDINKLLRNQTESPHTTSEESDSAFAKYWCGRQSLEIRRKASQGFIYAQTLLTSKEYFADGAELFVIFADTDSGSSISLRNAMLHAFANCFRTTEIVSVLPVQHRARIVEIARDTMRMCKEDVSPVDCDARICYAFLTAHSLDETIHFLSVSKLKYPQEVVFPDLQVNLHGFRNQFKEALKIAMEALKKFPQHVGLLENKAKLLFYLNASDMGMQNRVEEAFADFLEFAPVDHRKVPDVYYCLGQISLASCEESSLADADNYYDLGLQSEQNLLSCFIPYDSQHKKGLKLQIDLLHKITKSKPGSSSRRKDNKPQPKPGNKNAGTESDSKSGKFLKKPDDQSYVTQTSPFRIQLVLKHRQGIKSMLDEQREKRGNPAFEHIVVGATLKPLREQRIPTVIAGLKEIKLDDMSRTVDHVYKGRVLNVLIIEDSLFHLFPSVHCVIMDEDGDFQWGYFYNFDHKDPAVRKKFSFGSKLSILNPYHRLTGDGHSGIRVDDPQSVVFHSAGNDGGEELCRFCWKKNPPLQCANCKRFKYCSKKCQTRDWRLLRHKDVCVPSAEHNLKYLDSPSISLSFHNA